MSALTDLLSYYLVLLPAAALVGAWCHRRFDQSPASDR